MAHPDKYHNAKEYVPLVRDGTLKAEIDENYPKAIIAKQLPPHLWLLYHQE